ncbi:DNA polymerase/3'-5' exonuclease PolX [Natrinema thermotolerans]|uniref:DNA polymerase beta n=1 Tax=Natrinema thermotolerans TaxID=121872 RepID=A0AAF0T1K3_9EURY|nr:DNA polymerase/3'-5' exonuclease PolX [Natrinema thermotolerans]QCC60482.1 DNA polymerase/3'-5' exonuclease PolX [Natrinema thermotolerans]QCC61382.1 DNA polymerase/3'-5' exonuclease PolX [Natrinema thermotolerans]WMT07516.1 DNA polymerase/3'-5' exonuclease PolX [Natrinema thermotolerans]WMT08148.1 DNA polymerase/3'-5' exonuclease PolX [Natrinema thermotolerans]
MTTNAEIAARFEEFADLLEADDVEYKPRAYRRAAENVRAHPSPIADRVAAGDREVLENIDGVGDAISAKIVEYVETGGIEELEELRAELPIDIADITRIEGVGPKTAGKLYRELGVETLDDLEDAAEAGEIQDVKGFGPKTEQNILENLEFARTVGQRQLLGEARPLADDVLAYLEGLEAVERCEVAGSIRRWRETIGDVDVLAATEDGEAVVEQFVSWESVDDEIESGPEKASVRVGESRVDLRVVVPAEFGSALQYFTGSKDHNVALRNYAIDRGMKLNEYGAFDVSGVEDHEADQRIGDRIAGETEAGMYEALGLAWIPPELRTDRGEIDAAAAGELPTLLERDDIRGDLHTHTEWSDGNTSIEAMVEAAADRGYDYFGIADHAEGPGVVGGMGLADDEILEQVAEIRAVGDDADIEVLAGIEANVDAAGEVDLSEDVIDALDVIVASTHSALSQDAETATERLVRAVENPTIDVLGHPSGRLLNERAGLEFDATALGAAAADHDTALEVNSNPRRLDLWGSAVQAAIDEGAVIAVNTDAHRPATLEYMRWGVHTARRGWAEPADVINTWGLAALREFLH